MYDRRMSTRKKMQGVGVLVCFLLLVPQVGQTATPTAVERALLLEQILRLQEQVAALQALLASRAAPEAGLESWSQGVPLTVTYDASVGAAYIGTPAHRTYFSRVETLFPDLYRAKLGQFSVFNAERNIDAFVETIPPQHQRWRYVVHEAELGGVGSESSDELIIHELGHVVAIDRILRAGTVDTRQQHFTERFWSEADIAAAAARRESDDVDDRRYRYYLQHQDAFVSDYATTDPQEDFAESFTFFVLGREPEGREAGEKIAFFADDASMRAVREEIRLVR